MPLIDRLHTLTTLITANTGNSMWQATGFFFRTLTAPDTQGNRFGKDDYLVTNRHVIFSKATGMEVLADNLNFSLRYVDPTTQSIQWYQIPISNADLRVRAYVSPDPSIDVAVVKIGDLVQNAIGGNPTISFGYGVVTEADLPSQNGFDVEVCDDTVVIGYPRGYYDMKNLFPIVKSGIIASACNIYFNGHPFFLTDVKLYGGSSGSLVITKPSYQYQIAGKPITFKEKKFALLGVYSGEPIYPRGPVQIDEELTIIKNSSYNLGIVWYSSLIMDIINQNVHP